MKKNLSVAVLQLVFGTTAAWAAQPGVETGLGRAAAEQRWQFKVSLGDKEIGRQTFTVERRGDRSTVTIAADFDVRYVALSFYRYRHRNTEVWRGGCLQSMQAVTDDNGEKLTVDGTRVPGGFEVKATKATLLLPECIMSFAYWDPEFLKQNRLLNSQTGLFEEVRISRVGSERISVRRQPIDATRYKLQGKAIDIDLWYAAGGQWVRLESDVNNSRLTYDLI